MRNRVLWICLMMVMTVLISVRATTVRADEGKPSAVVENPVHNFGLVYAGKSVVHSFTIKNTGDAPLVIESVRTG